MEKQCIDCGTSYIGHIKSIRCPACQSEARKRYNVESQARRRAGIAREMGSTDLCEACGKPYIVVGPLQRYCKDCAPEAVRANLRAESIAYNRRRYGTAEARAELNKKRRDDRAAIAVVCKQCGREFIAENGALFCSEECREANRASYYKEYDDNRKEKKKAYNHQRWAAMTPEQREENNRKMRENYAKRKAKKKEQS